MNVRLANWVKAIPNLPQIIRMKVKGLMGIWWPVVLAYVTAILAISISILIDMYELTEEVQWKTFQRSGSFVVFIAFILGWYFINIWIETKMGTAKKWIEDKEGVLHDLLKEEIFKINIEITKRTAEEISKRTTEKFGSDIGQSIKGYFGSLQQKFLVAEILLAGVGTIIWGYGDLFPCLWRACLIQGTLWLFMHSAKRPVMAMSGGTGPHWSTTAFRR